MSILLGSICIKGSPYGKASPRVVMMGKNARAYPPKSDKDYSNKILVAIDEAFLKSSKPVVVTDPRQPLCVHISARFKRPSSHYKKSGELSAEGLRWLQPTKKPDTDNISKIILDTMTKAKLWVDDSQITQEYITKDWCEDDEEESVLVSWFNAIDTISYSVPV